MRRLAPPLSVIEDALFDPSPALLQRWLEGDPSLSAERRAALEADPAAQAYATVWRQEPPAPCDQPPDFAVALPAHLAEQIEARVAANALNLAPEPRPGLILQIDSARIPSGPLDWDLARPLAVLLSEPAEHPSVWYGWLMSPETDYASYWDLLLEEGDAPVDPSVAMVQVYNPVHIYCPAASRALGQLAPPRLAAVRTLAADFLLGDTTSLPETDPGMLLQRTTSEGHLIVTGTPLGDEQDPRHAYQELYIAVADYIRAMAGQALAELAEPAPAPWWQRTLAALRDAADQWQVTLTPVPVLAMGPGSSGVSESDTTVATWRLGETLDLQLIPGPDGQSVQIHATLAPGQPPVTLALVEADGLVTQQRRLDAQQPDGDLWAEAGLTLSVRDEAGGRLFEARLPDPLAGQS